MMGVKLVNGVFTNDAGKQFSTGKKKIQQKNIREDNCYFPETILKKSYQSLKYHQIWKVFRASSIEPTWTLFLDTIRGLSLNVSFINNRIYFTPRQFFRIVLISHSYNFSKMCDIIGRLELIGRIMLYVISHG